MAHVIWDGDTDTTYTTAGNWAGGAAPVATNAVTLEGANPIAGSDQSGTAIDELVDSLAANIGSNIAYLQVDPDSLEVNFTAGTHYLDIGAVALAPIIKNTTKPSSGYGMYLKGTGMTTLTMYGGSVAVAGQLDEVSTVATVRINSGSTIYLGPGTTATTVYMDGGTAIVGCAATTVTINNGTLITTGSGVITTLNQYGGTSTLNSTGNVTTANHYGGLMDAVGDGFAKTIVTYNPFTEGSPILKSNSNVTITNFNKPTARFQAAWSSA